MKAMKAVGCGLVCALVSMAGAAGPEEKAEKRVSTMVLSHVDGGQDEKKVKKFEIKIENDKVVDVRVNGEPVSADRVKRDGDKFIFVDEQGGEIRELEVGGGQWVSQFMAGEPERLPVMVGVRMSEPGEALRSQLRLGDRRVILVEEAMKGLPAAEAGLRTYDIIVSIDGSDDATPEVLQQKLKGKKPGDELRVVVLRGGEKAEHKVVLRAFDPEKMGMTATVQTEPGAPAAEGLFLRQSRSNQQAEELRGVLEKARQQITDPAAREEMERAIAQAMKAVEQAGASAMQGIELEVMPRITRSPSSAGGSWFVDRENRVIEVPEGMARRFEGLAPSSDAMTRRLEELEKRMDALNAQMEQQMNRMMDRLEQMLDRVEKRNRGEN